jgi:threonyl-tRNA synthetase
LTRVRRFCQDDAHIFCRPDQIGSEISGCFEFLKKVYGIFGFSFSLELSTRPEKDFIGELSTWEIAENALREQLNKFVGQDGWKLNPGTQSPLPSFAPALLSSFLLSFILFFLPSSFPPFFSSLHLLGDGAFYGPKIDVHVFDAMKRKHQCATIQLDFNLPEKFNLKFVSDSMLMMVMLMLMMLMMMMMLMMLMMMMLMMLMLVMIVMVLTFSR